jgi:hypothetical protein
MVCVFAPLLHEYVAVPLQLLTLAVSDAVEVHGVGDWLMVTDGKGVQGPPQVVKFNVTD